MKKFLIFLIILLMPLSVVATEAVYQFDSPRDQQRFEALTTQLRCLVCQNQNIAESNAALATDLRKQVYDQIQKGETDKHIIEYLVVRYGDFILYRPPFNGVTLGLWLGPFLVLFAGISYLIYYLRFSRVQK